MKFFKIIISILCLASIIPFTACSDESPFEVVEDDLANASDDVYYDQKSSKCYNGVDEYNSWCCEHFEEKCYVRYSSSSSMSESEKCYYGTGELSDSYCCSYYGYQCSNIYSSSSYVSESEKCRLGTSSYSDSYCCSYYGYRCRQVQLCFKQFIALYIKQFQRSLLLDHCKVNENYPDLLQTAFK